MQISGLDYFAGGQRFAGYLADGSGGKRVPGILVAHEGGGMSEHPQMRARMLAEDGFVALVMDTYGPQVQTREQGIAEMNRLLGDLPDLRQRARTALSALKALPQVDPDRTAAIGFCFGGTTVLELARSGADTKAVVGFHGGLQTTAPRDATNITCKVLVLLGEEDPLIPEAQRNAFIAEMKAGGVDWQMMLYAGAGHSFTNPAAGAFNMPGFFHHPRTANRAWAAMKQLFAEVF